MIEDCFENSEAIKTEDDKGPINHRTNGPVNAHLIYVANISTKTSFAEFDIVVK